MVMMVHFAKTPFAVMDVIQIMENVFIQKNVYVSLDGKDQIVLNVFHTGIVLTDTVMNPTNAYVLMDFLVRIAIQPLNIKMVIGQNGVNGQAVWLMKQNEGKDHAMPQILLEMDFTAPKMEVFPMKHSHVKDGQNGVNLEAVPKLVEVAFKSEKEFVMVDPKAALAHHPKVLHVKWVLV